MARIDLIAVELSAFKTLYGRNLNADELKILTLSWSEAFENISDAEFIEACTEVRKTSKFFPVPANVAEAIEQNRKKVRPETIQALAEGEQSKAENKWNSLIAGKVCMKSIMSGKRCPLAEVALDITRPWAEREQAAREFLGKDFPEKKA